MIDFIMLGGAKLKMEEEKKKKKAWTTPTLTPIVRRKPEEGILYDCKSYLTNVVGGSNHQGCSIENCSTCDVVVDS